LPGKGGAKGCPIRAVLLFGGTVPGRGEEVNRTMARDSSAKGRAGEDAAARLLEQAGFTIIERNFRSEAGEVDIVAEDHGTLVFVEVKAWNTYGIESLEFSINKKKQKKIIQTAKFFLESHREYSNNQIRFDVVFIGPGFARHLASAFMESV
jgi:putative endonuclease